MVEIHSEVAMIRDGSTGPMANLEFHHNDETITEHNKNHVATILAHYVVKQLNININR